MLWDKKTVLAKAETVYGTDPTPTGAANAIEFENFSIEPLAGQRIERQVDRPYLGARLGDLVNEHVVMTFDVGIAGAGAAGTAPAWGVLHRGCGFAEVVDDGVDVTYTPISDAFESLGVYVNIDGTLHKASGVRGTLTARLRASDYPRWSYRMLGLFQAVTAAALPTVDMEAWMRTVPVTKVNTPTFTLDGYAARMEELSIDLAHNVEGRFLVGYEGIEITGRASTGRVSIEAPAVGTKDFFALAASKPPGAGVLQLIHGTAAGHIVEIGAPKAEIGQPTYANVQRKVHLQMPLTFQPDAGNDELSIVVR